MEGKVEVLKQAIALASRIELEELSAKLSTIHNTLIVEGLVKHGGTGLDGSLNLQTALYHINSTLAHLRRQESK